MITLNHLHYLANVKRVKNLKSVTISFSEVETTFDVYFTDDEFDYTFDAHATAGYGGIIWVYNYEHGYKLEDLVTKGDSFSFQHVHRYLDFIVKIAPFVKSIDLKIYKDCACLNVDGVMVSLDDVYDDNYLLCSMFPRINEVIVHPDIVQQVTNLKARLP